MNSGHQLPNQERSKQNRENNCILERKDGLTNYGMSPEELSGKYLTNYVVERIYVPLIKKELDPKYKGELPMLLSSSLTFLAKD